MTSRFSYKSYSVLFLAIIIIYFLVTLIFSFFSLEIENYEKANLALTPLLFLFFIWLVFGELRTKMILFQIDKEKIIVKKLFGILGNRIYKISEVDGYKISKLQTKSGVYEYLYIIKDGKKIAKLSEFYHKNYNKIKDKIKEEIVYLGFEKYHHFSEIKEMFE